MPNIDFLAVIHECAVTSTEVQESLSKGLQDTFAGEVRLSTDTVSAAISLLKLQTMLLNSIVEENQTILDGIQKVTEVLTRTKTGVEAELKSRGGFQ